MLDRALWITWYDLPADGRDAYFSWMHGVYIPGLLEHGRFLWAAHYASVPKEQKASSGRDKSNSHTTDPDVPRGDRYILVVGAAHANRFGDPVPSALHAALPADSKRMLAMREGERVNVMTEAARVEGPAFKDYADGMKLAPCIQLGSYNCPWQYEEAMLAWYAQARMPAMAGVPGCIRTRRLASVSGWAKHAVLYEFVSPEARNLHFYKHEAGSPEMKAWSDRLVPKLVHAPGSANLARRIWPAIV